MKHRLYLLLVCLALTGLFHSPLRAQAPEITITPASDPIDLGSVKVGETSGQQRVTVKISPLGGFDHKYSVKFESGQSSDFYTTSAFFDPSTESATMYLFLKPQSVGQKEGHIVIRNDQTELRRVRVIGVGISDTAPEFDTGDYHSIEFGKIEVGQEYKRDLSVTTRHSGPKPTVRLQGTNADEFRVIGSLRPNTEAQILTIIAKPRSDGEKCAELYFTDGEVNQVLPLRATANYPKPYLSAEVEKLDFPDTYVGKTSSLTLRVDMQNIFIKPTITLQGVQKELFKIEGELPVQAEHGNIQVLFTPQKESKAEAVLLISSGEAKLEIPLQGWGFEEKAPEILVDPAAIDFGQVEIQTYASQSVQVTTKHTSAAPEVTLGGNDQDIFTIVSQPQGGQFSLTISAIPNRAGKQTAEVILKLPTIEKKIPITLTCTAPNPVLRANRTEIDFGEVAVGTTSPERGVEVEMAQLSEDVKVTIEGQDATSFKASKAAIDRTAPRGFVGVTCTPSKEGSLDATLVLTSEALRVEIALKTKAVTAIETINDRHILRVDNSGAQQLSIHVSEPGQHLVVYAIDGTTLSDEILQSSSRTITNLPTGPYIVRYKDALRKVFVR